jgi:hypothetical protein
VAGNRPCSGDHAKRTRRPNAMTPQAGQCREKRPSKGGRVGQSKKKPRPVGDGAWRVRLRLFPRGRGPKRPRYGLPGPRARGNSIFARKDAPRSARRATAFPKSSPLKAFGFLAGAGGKRLRGCHGLRRRASAWSPNGPALLGVSEAVSEAERLARLGGGGWQARRRSGAEAKESSQGSR